MFSFDRSSLLGDIGGYLGLFLGFSIFGLVDILKDGVLFGQKICNRSKSHQGVASED